MCVTVAADLLGQQHAGQMTERADAGVRDPGVLSGLVHPAHQLADIVRRQRRARRNGRSSGVDEADGDEILFGVEGKIRIERHARRHRNLMQQHRIAVGRGAGGASGSDHAAGAADVLDDDLLAERLRHAVLDDARDRIGRAAGRVRHHERDRTAGIGLRRRGAGRQDTRGEKRRRECACESHDASPAVYLFRPAAA